MPEHVVGSNLNPEPAGGPASPLPLVLVRNPRARRYILRVTRDGQVRITIPRGGNESFARRFAAEKRDWIDWHRQRQIDRAQTPNHWEVGTLVWYRGARIPLELRDATGWLGDLRIEVRPGTKDWRPAVIKALHRVAQVELPALVIHEARRWGTPIRRVSVRNQRTRWGSCSRKGTISLNWRLVQAPLMVRDYLIVHELAHVREMNHSRRFWSLVQEWFPAWASAEEWLRRHGRELLD
ncbi:MAG: M48 family metallopeptidase [Verrucomicrobiales bacterium]|nr:M48 family metallopeptidase [Verrucomicrobiales bacterium]